MIVYGHRTNITKEFCEKMSKLNKGKKLSKEQVEKLKNRIFSEETREKISKSSLGREIHTDESKEYLRQRWLGENNPNFGKVYTDEELEKFVKPILQFSKNGELIKEWKSMTEASETLNIFRTNISKVCRGKRKSAGGFIWKYKNSENQDEIT